MEAAIIKSDKISGSAWQVDLNLYLNLSSILRERGDKTDSNLNGIYLKTLLLKVKKFRFEIESIEIGEKFLVLKILYS